jgi:hypothetical protein
MEENMRCLLCRNLESAFEARRREYTEASSLAYYSVSKKFAAYMNVEMERALIELQEHRSICLSANNETLHGPAAPQFCRPPQEAFVPTAVIPAA